MSAIQNLIVHCSDSLWGDARTIRDWHLARGWKDIGYHGVICNGYRSPASAYEPGLDGKLEPGRLLDLDSYIRPSEIGAHALGYNKNSIGVCLIGVDRFSTAQLDCLYAFCCVWACAIPGISILGHCEVDPHKTCPNLDMNQVRAELARRYPNCSFANKP